METSSTQEVEVKSTTLLIARVGKEVLTWQGTLIARTHLCGHGEIFSCICWQLLQVFSYLAVQVKAQWQECVLITSLCSCAFRCAWTVKKLRWWLGVAVTPEANSSRERGNFSCPKEECVQKLHPVHRDIKGNLLYPITWVFFLQPRALHTIAGIES